MWTDCCNWFCLDSRTADEPERTQNRGQWTEAYVNAGFNPHPSAVEHTCKACNRIFDSISRKHVCVDCKKNFCTACSAQLENNLQMCHTCQRFRATAFQREELMKLKVKDLRDYLDLHGISTQMCREKEDLVELVLGQQVSVPGSPSSHPQRAFDNNVSEQQSFLSGIQTNSIPATSQEAPPAYEEAVFSPQVEITEDGQVPVPGEPVDGIQTETTAEMEDESQSTDSEDVLVPGRRASLSDLNCLEDIETLSVRQLKEILARNFVNYKGCCEKWELMERVTRLYNEQKDLHSLNGEKQKNVEESICKICMDAPIDCVLLECGHMVTCTKCGKRMNECPVCRQYVIRAVHVFRS
ncbi:E3 ubiquitin-protein ligase rififylin isoform X2 [Protopterus annectens]|uniref:E3 ubiquitin-protein ligase rififylin isoform X2 n=1 Tax=Protopterus annectens TaxID=7888 RepID=UPI001CFB6B97|nr:E3 ubiquitin-protein ligase rififylin isoform X2 [Protopterus annectens]